MIADYWVNIWLEKMTCWMVLAGRWTTGGKRKDDWATGAHCSLWWYIYCIYCIVYSHWEQTAYQIENLNASCRMVWKAEPIVFVVSRNFRPLFLILYLGFFEIFVFSKIFAKTLKPHSQRLRRHNSHYANMYGRFLQPLTNFKGTTSRNKLVECI